MYYLFSTYVIHSTADSNSKLYQLSWCNRLLRDRTHVSMATKKYNIIYNPWSINSMVLTSLETGWLAGKNTKCSEVSEFWKGPVYSIYLMLITCWMPFFVGLYRICLCANVLNFDYWHLFIATSKKKGTNDPLLKQLVTLFKPAGYYYYCNPCKVWSFHFKTLGLMILPVLEQMLPLKSSKSDLNLHF